jgi:thiamine kinase-like enzyme
MADAGLALIGKKPRVVNIYKEIHQMLNSIEHLTERDWKCSYDNLIMLRNSIVETDSQVNKKKSKYKKKSLFIS